MVHVHHDDVSDQLVGRVQGYKGWIPVEECFSKIENAAEKRFEIVFMIR